MLRFFLAVSIAIAPELAAAATTPTSKPWQSAWDTLYKAMADGNPDHRRQALMALGTLGASNDLALKNVEKGLKDKDPMVRQTAAAVLGEMQAREAIPELRAALDDSDGVAFSAAVALARMGDESGKFVMIAVLAGNRSPEPGFVSSKLREARSDLRHPTKLMILGAKEATGAALGPAATPFLGPATIGLGIAQDALKDSGAPGRVLATDTLAKDPEPYAEELLEWALADSNWAVRAAAAKGVGARGNTASIPKLEPLLHDAHNGARTMAAAAIIQIMTRENSMASRSVNTDPE
ncbi:MAG TPA: HEAT repeat domain-containing protein [Bryobacteraceae bacterium]|nr:HEAT repeat domain-containing protein [Bryobacteraceae bacterium]